MTPTIKAILARFNGNRTKAAQYCSDIAWTYPHLCREYMALRDMIRAERKQS